MLAKLPKLLRSTGAPDQAELSRRLDEWASAAQHLLAGLRAGVAGLESRLTALAADVGEGGGATGAFAAPSPLAIGGANAEGTSEDLVRADHAHGMPDFGSGAGDVCEGDDARLSDDRVAAGLRTASTVVGVSSSTAPSADQVLVATSSTAAEWAGLGDLLPAVEVFNQDIPPATAGSLDDEFTGSYSGWSEWRPGTVYADTITATSRSLEIEFTSSGTNILGLYKTAPAGSDYSIYAKVSVNSPYAGAQPVWVGLILGEALATSPTTSDFVVLYLTTSASGWQVAFGRYTAHNATVVDSEQNTPLSPQHLYLRLQRTGTSIRGGYSFDGLDWIVIGNSTIAYTPAEAGIVLRGSPSGYSGRRATVYWFRSLAGTPSLLDRAPGGGWIQAAYLP